MTTPKGKLALAIIVGAKDQTKAVFGKVKARLTSLLDPVKLANLAVSKMTSLVSYAAQRFAVLGAAAGGALIYLTNSTTRAADATAKLARRIGLSGQTLQEWRYAAEQSGVKGELLDNALRKLGQRMAEARAGYGDAMNALRALGIQLVDTEGNALGLSEVFPKVLDAIDGLQDPTSKLAFAVKLFEEEGTGLIQMANGGAHALWTMGRQAHRTGRILTDEQLAASEAYQSSLNQFGALVTGIKNRLVFALLPTIQAVATQITDWLANNQDQFDRWGEWLSVKAPQALEAFGRKWREHVQPLIDSAMGLNAEPKEGTLAYFLLNNAARMQQIAADPAGFGASVLGETPKAAASIAEQAFQLFDQGMIRLFPRLAEPLPGSGPVRSLDQLMRDMDKQSSASPVGGELRVSFANAPRGTRVERDAAARRSTSLSVGYTMPEVGLG